MNRSFGDNKGLIMIGIGLRLILQNRLKHNRIEDNLKLLNR